MLIDRKEIIVALHIKNSVLVPFPRADLFFLKICGRLQEEFQSHHTSPETVILKEQVFIQKSGKSNPNLTNE